MNVVSRFGSFGKEVSLMGDHANEGDFYHSTLASEGHLEFRKVNLIFLILALVENLSLIGISIEKMLG